MNIIFEQTFSLVKHELPVTLKYENLIFVFEDVDVASPIVRCRVAKSGVSTSNGIRSSAVSDCSRA